MTETTVKMTPEQGNEWAGQVLAVAAERAKPDASDLERGHALVTELLAAGLVPRIGTSLNTVALAEHFAAALAEARQAEREPCISALQQIVDMIAGCPDAPKAPDSLDQMVLAVARDAIRHLSQEQG